MTLTREQLIKELQYYDLQKKIIYCINDDEHSVLYNILKEKFNSYNLKHLYAAKLRKEHLFEDNFILAYDGKQQHKEIINGDTKYNSGQLIHIIKKADIIITMVASALNNMITYLQRYGKYFLLYGDTQRLKHKNMLQYLNNNIIHLGHTQRYTTHTYRWITNIGTPPQPLPIPGYIIGDNIQKYDNYDAAYVHSLNMMPQHYEHPIGVPLHFIDYFTPQHYHIIKAQDNLYYNDIPLPSQLIIQKR